jgi:hypothetical protein
MGDEDPVTNTDFNNLMSRMEAMMVVIKNHKTQLDALTNGMTSTMMTHKYRGCIVVLLINKNVEPNEEQKVLTSVFDQGFTVNTSKWVFRGIW